MRLLVLPGDGIGEEITRANLIVLDAASDRYALGLSYCFADVGFSALRATGTTLPDDVMEMARGSEGIILGPISHLDYPPREEGGINISATMRVHLDLYANVRPARTRRGLQNKVGDFDLVIMREATEGFYPDRNMYMGSGEFMPDENMAMSIRKITARASERIALASFELARRRKRKVTAVHKANAFLLTDGLFLREVRKVAKKFPDVELEEVIVDTMAALLVRRPSAFDVICATNFHADILSDLASELSGGLGIGGSINMNERQCCAQAQHGSAPDIAGQDKANPTSLILSSAMLLDWMGQKHGNEKLRGAARAINLTVDHALSRAETRTVDLGGNMGTSAFAHALAEQIRANP